MELINKINMYLEITVYIVIGLIMMGIGTWYYFRTRPKAKKKEDHIDYSTLPRKPSTEMVLLDDIVENMIITDNGSRFVAGVKCNGFDYRTARPEEKLAVQGNYIQLFNMIDSNIQFYMQCQDVDVEHTLTNHEEAKENILKKLESKTNELKNLWDTRAELMERELKHNNELEELESDLGEKEDSNYTNFLNETNLRIEKVERSINRLEWKYRHMLEMIAYTKTVSENKEDPQRNDYYFFSYKFNPLAFSVSLSKGEIEKRAAEELRTRADNFCSILRTSKVKAEMVEKDELIDIVRRHYNPISANIYKKSNIQRSNYFDMVTTTNDYDATKEKYVLSEVYKIIDESIKKEGA